MFLRLAGYEGVGSWERGWLCLLCYAHVFKALKQCEGEIARWAFLRVGADLGCARPAH